MTAAVNEPSHLADLSGDLRAMHRVLGRLADALLAGRAETVIFDLGPNALDPMLIGGLWRWTTRNKDRIRTRTRASVFVIPSLWARVQWRLVLFLDRPPVRTAVVRTRDEATAWIEGCRATAEDRQASRG